jgi:NADPH-dependent 2,4-dienoyl-CoA reductase/sulfur reductase-like enzyme
MAAALTLGLRGHRVVVLEAAAKVRGVINIIPRS